ncbi:3'-5' exoribonuclease [Herbaspirillum lusitanum]|uniref:3'-5' exoribonuclease n=1 Tax=Herbaspirillum lusitanum TaxID=213312 RepID=A0ABW9AFP5_9BURK
MSLKVFVDTEFTNFVDTHLISIGMAAASGEEFYAEVPYPLDNCSEFVREVVIPLLGRVPNAFCPIDDLYMKITSWLKIIRPHDEDVDICFDYQTDWDLFSVALDGRVPAWCRPCMVSRNINELLRYEFHKKNKLPEHHALYDAQANRYAYRERLSIST